jgi:hypothetical protein
MNQALNSRGLFVYAFGTTDYGYLLKIYVGDGFYVVIAEDQDISCVVTSGKDFYLSRGQKI